MLGEAAPLAQTRIQLLGEAVDLLRFLFIDGEELTYNEKAVRKLKDSAPQVLAQAAKTVEALPESQYTVDGIHEALTESIIEGLELKPRVAFGPLFVAMTGTNASIPVFNSMVILGREETL
ncbi:glutamate--tRNA ligase, partial [Pauljensenia sp. UMB0018B]|nr:glutamate--tRNA ligase [Pauljensenia sp. UMB0018B]